MSAPSNDALRVLCEAIMKEEDAKLSRIPDDAYKTRTEIRTKTNRLYIERLAGIMLNLFKMQQHVEHVLLPVIINRMEVIENETGIDRDEDAGMTEEEFKIARAEMERIGGQLYHPRYNPAPNSTTTDNSDDGTPEEAQ